MKSKLEKISDKCDKIYLDCDGVIIASNETMCKMLNILYDKNHKGSEVISWDYTNLYPTSSIEVESLFNAQAFFDNVEFVKGAKKYLTKYRKKIIIVTKGSPTNYIRKRWWFNDKGFGDIPIIPIPITLSKGLINMKGGLLIDDNTNNLKESNATWKIQFVEYNDNKKREWQEGWKGYKIYGWKMD